MAGAARDVAAGWWLDAQAGAASPGSLPRLAAGLRLRCLAAADGHLRALDGLERAGNAGRARDARRRAEALLRAAEELRRYE